MKIIVNQNGEIRSYVQIGDIPGSIEYKGTVPDGFEDNFQPSFYLLQNDSIVLNPDYVMPTTPVTGPSDTDKAIAQLTLQAAQQKVTQDKLNAQVLLEIAQLKGGNN
ncbi:DUF2977 domain-containing protein [Latilactobacillus sakei]|uniref:DUF2977 domain-containing protein n=1 Tax=Latilactobacillus sakei TaxID=1599 RepID=UPI003B9B5D1F